VAALIAREQQGDYLRIAISGGGCNGLSYKLKFTPEPRRGDILVRSAGTPVLVDRQDGALPQGHPARLLGQAHRGRFQVLQPERQGQLLLRREFQRLTPGC
jgi:Fe-S cluster assembly iron-binding protein IscA